MHTETNFKIIQNSRFEYDISLTDNEIKRILTEISFNKAGGWDALIDTTFKLCARCRKLDSPFCKTCTFIAARTREIFTKKFWEDPISKVHFLARLIALDKSKNGKPGPTDFRPLVLSSIISKILEAYFIDQFRNYCSNKLNLGQIGGVKGRSILDNILRLHFEKVKFGKNAHIMFIDFVGAFSNLPRQFAIEALQKKEVLNKNGMMI